MKRKGKGKTILIVIGVIFVLGLIGALFSDKDKNGKNNSEKQENYGLIEDFSYDLEGNKIILNSYKGKDKILEIETSYEIEGKEYETDISDFQIGVGNNDVEAIIFDEGFAEIKDSTFNSSDVQKVFFPKSMSIVYDNTLSYLHPKDGETIKIYYAGTQEEWEQIFTEYERTKVTDAELGEEMGKALADKLNEMIGAGYDSSEFEYFFSASPEDLK